jgi:hypothetical protein
MRLRCIKGTGKAAMPALSMLRAVCPFGPAQSLVSFSKLSKSTLKFVGLDWPVIFFDADADASGKVPNPSRMQEAIDAGKENVVGGWYKLHILFLVVFHFLVLVDKKSQTSQVVLRSGLG